MNTILCWILGHKPLTATIKEQYNPIFNTYRTVFICSRCGCRATRKGKR